MNSSHKYLQCYDNDRIKSPNSTIEELNSWRLGQKFYSNFCDCFLEIHIIKYNSFNLIICLIKCHTFYGFSLLVKTKLSSLTIVWKMWSGWTTCWILHWWPSEIVRILLMRKEQVPSLGGGQIICTFSNLPFCLMTLRCSLFMGCTWFLRQLQD